MSLGLYLAATLKNPSLSVTEQVAKWARGRLSNVGVAEGVDGEGRAAVFVRLHPAAEDVEFVDVGGRRLLVAASTSGAGPGYHAYLVDVLDDLSRYVPLEWAPFGEDQEYSDETGYFESRDFVELQHQMLLWLRALAKHCADGEEGIQVALPLTHQFVAPGFALTPMGVRDRAWFQSVSEDPRRGIDFFAWWERGKQAQYHLGLALSRMWTEVRWRLPDSDEERKVLSEVLDALETSFKLDPSKEYPWAEWREILDLTERRGKVADHVRKRAVNSEAPSIGYRRFPVRASLVGGWSIRLDGAMSEEWDDRGTFCASFGGRTVWFTAFRIPERASGMSPEEILGERSGEPGEHFEWRDGALLSRALLKRSVEDGADFWLLKTDSVAPPRRAACTICFHDDGDRDWALATWKSLSPGRS